jgi:uncharacterized GH25 family protein
MKKTVVLLALSLCMAAPSFAAEHVVTHSAKVVGKDSYKVAAVSAKDAGKAGKAVVKFFI